MNFRPNLRAEKRYAEEVLAAFRAVFEEAKRLALPVRSLSVTEFLRKYAEQAARRMVTGLYVEGQKSWRAAARESGRSDLVYRALQNELKGPVGERIRELVRENAKLISTFPESVAAQVAARAAALGAEGGRAEALTGEIRFLGTARSRARLIARTEVSKAGAALTRARAEELNLDWYVWETSEDRRVRFSHRKMQGVLVNYAEPPAPEQLVGEKSEGSYNAGEIFNCRCYAAPVLWLTQVQFPARVYYGGRVRRVTLAEFKRISGIQKTLQEAA